MLNYDGLRLMLVEAPYFTDEGESAQYEAGAVDRLGNEYLVRWDCHEYWELTNATTEHCNWEHPVEIKRV